MGRGECIPDLARTGGAGGACNPHVVGPHRRTVSECAETGAPGVPTIRCRSVRPGALAARTAGWSGVQTWAAIVATNMVVGAWRVGFFFQSVVPREPRPSARPPRRSRKRQPRAVRSDAAMHGGLAGRLAGDTSPCLSGAVYAASVRRGAVANDPRAPATVAARGRTKAYAMRFSCFCPVNPSPAFSMTRPEPLPWWARGTATLRGGCTQVRPRRGGIAARARPDGGQDMSIPAGWVSVADVDKWMRSQPSAREAI